MSNNPFLDPEYLIDYNLAGKDVKTKIRDKTSPPPAPGEKPKTPPIVAGSLSKLGANHYLLKKIPHQKNIVPALEFTTLPLDGGKDKNQSSWSTFSYDDWKVPDAETMYQVMRRCYDLFVNKRLQSKVQSCVTELRSRFDERYHLTLTKVAYRSGLDAIVSHIGTFPSSMSTIVTIPEFTRHDDYWSYLILAKEQPENQIGTVEALSPNAHPILEALLGEGYDQAGAVFQYCSSRKGNNLREVRLWMPTAKNRNSECVVALGVNNDRFNLNANDNIDNNRPALGIAFPPGHFIMECSK